jgi:hypothetical protein
MYLFLQLQVPWQIIYIVSFIYSNCLAFKCDHNSDKIMNIGRAFKVGWLCW